MRPRKPSLAVWKFASCDGCQLTPARLRGRVAGRGRRGGHRVFPRGLERRREGPYDVSLVEGSITTPHDAERIHEVRARPKSARHHRRLRHRRRHPGAAQFCRRRANSPRSSTRRPSTSRRLATSTPIADHVEVDFELRGCPINKRQLVEVISALPGRPQAQHSAAQRLHRMQAARHRLRDGRRGDAVPGPVTQPAAAPSALPSTAAATAASARWNAQHRGAGGELQALGAQPRDIVRLFRTFNAARRPSGRKRAP